MSRETYQDQGSLDEPTQAVDETEEVEAPVETADADTAESQ